MAIGSETYPPEFFDRNRVVSGKSAEIVVPLVVDLLAPSSVVDLGCGAGAWLEAFAAAGVDDLLGVDGPWVPLDRIAIRADQFVAHDLREPYLPTRRFDLAVSLETGEHLPEEAAEPLVAALAELAPVVLFSAAEPGQGGRDHVNEQWPRWWAELFAGHGFEAIDWLRPRLGDRRDLAPWFRRNLLLFAHRDRIASDPRLHEAWVAEGGMPLPWLGAGKNRNALARWREAYRVRDAWRAAAEDARADGMRQAFDALAARLADGPDLLLPIDGTTFRFTLSEEPTRRDGDPAAPAER